MTDEGTNWDEEKGLDEDDPGEVPTSFATKGLGWSGREGQPEEDDQPT